MAISRIMIIPFVLCSLVDIVLFPIMIVFSIWGYMRLGTSGIAMAVLPAAIYAFYVSRFFGLAWARGNCISHSAERLANLYALKALSAIAWYAALAALLYARRPA